MISYAQNAEDVILERLFKGVDNGFFIDAGAAHPVFHSVSFHFYLKGWRGISIEPNPASCQELRATRPHDLTLNCGISDIEGSLTFYEVPPIKSWSTDPDVLVNAFGVDRKDIIAKVTPVTTLAKVCEQHANQPIDFLKIDVEGQEDQAIRGADWKRWRPRVVIVEAWHNVQSAHLIESGYIDALFDGINHYYVREEDRAWLELLKAPANSCDDYVLFKYIEFDTMKAKLAATQAALDESLATIEKLHNKTLSTRIGGHLVGIKKRMFHGMNTANQR